jgi:hypothetical protein
MSRYSKLGKHGTRTAMRKPAPILDADHQRQAGIRAQAKKDREHPDSVTMGDMLDYEHRYGAGGWTVGDFDHPGTHRSVTIYEDGEEALAVGLDADVFAA